MVSRKLYHNRRGFTVCLIVNLKHTSCKSAPCGFMIALTSMRHLANRKAASISGLSRGYLLSSAVSSAVSRRNAGRALTCGRRADQCTELIIESARGTRVPERQSAVNNAAARGTGCTQRGGMPNVLDMPALAQGLRALSWGRPPE